MHACSLCFICFVRNTWSLLFQFNVLFKKTHEIFKFTHPVGGLTEMSSPRPF